MSLSFALFVSVQVNNAAVSFNEIDTNSVEHAETVLRIVPGNQKSEISPRVIFSHASDGVLAAFLFQVHEKNSG